MTHDTLVSVEYVSKKFCRSLKRSLWYGARDVASALSPFSREKSEPAGERLSVPERKPLRPDEFWALDDVSFQLRRGECLGLIGHNGAGKSTLLKILNGLVPPDEGRIMMRGRVAALIELNAGFNPILTGRENIYNQAALLGFTQQEVKQKFDRIVEFAEIGDFLDMPVQNYSSGMRVRLGFAVSAQLEPDILIIDEVLAVGDVAFRFKCLNAISELMKNAAVIFVSHSMPQIFRICSEVIVLDHGRVVYHDTNVADGVSRYLSLYNNADGAVFGSGEVKVESLGLESGESKASMSETLSLPYGAELKLSARIRSSPEFGDARLQFLFWNAEMLPVLDVISDDLSGYLVPSSPSGISEVTAYLPRLELNSGKYNLSVIAVNGDQSRVLCRHDNAAYLQVDAATASGAHSLSVAEWAVT